MKFLKSIFFALLGLFLFLSPSKASHILGGEITWECTATGEYIFKMVVYRDCDGIPFTFQNEILGINGLTGVSSVTLKPDSTKWTRMNNGYLNPQCNAQITSQQLLCSNGDVGTIQALYFSSDPILLQGTSGPSGVTLIWDVPCCRPNDISNLAASGSQIISAKMFLNGRNSNPCADNSPIFSDYPDYIFCGRYNTSNEYNAFDLDGDSLVYSFARTYNNGFSAVPYAPGYSYTNPTPDANINNLNIPSTLNPRTGILNFSVFNGVGSAPKSYYIVSEVSAYRNGILNAQVRRELPIYLLDCPQLPNFTTNQPPRINPPFGTQASPSFQDSVVVGNPINASIFVLDTNLVNQGGQELTIQVSGNNLTHNYSINGNCPIPGDSSCAYIWSFTSPTYDSTKEVYVFKRQSNFNGNLRWTPDCSDLDSRGGAKTYNFLIRVQDDDCPVPGIRHEVIEITVLPDPMNPCGSITSLEENETLKDISIFPNPTSGLVQLKLPAEPLQLRILNIQGQLIEERQLNTNTEINLAGSSGVYFLEFTNQLGERVFKKIVKQ